MKKDLVPFPLRLPGRFGVWWIAGTLAVSSVFGQATPRINAGETVNVEVKIVPFYAADAQGRPVFDLRADEVELRVGGAPVPVESFDHYVIGARTPAPASSPATPARNIYLLFDTAFSSPRGFNADKLLAARMLEGWPAGDRLSLLVHGTRAGLEMRLGPVAADAEGKRELLAAIEELQPEIRRLQLQESPQEDFGPNGERGARNKYAPDIPQEQIHAAWDGLRGGAHGEYIGVAKSFASSLGTFASRLRGVPGPKLLLLFSQGLDSTLYFNGDDGVKVGTDESILVDTRRAPPLVDRFREPLAALAESGTMSVFVNSDRDVWATDADAAFRDMAKTTGGLYFTGTDPRELESRVAGSTSAYYEAGFRPAGPLLAAASTDVEIAVRRPGVRAWAPSRLRMWDSYRELGPLARRQMAIDLIAGGPGAQSAHTAVRLKLRDLGGKVVGQAAAGAPRLRFVPEWPADLANRKLDLYNVLLAPPEGGRKGRVLVFDQREASAGGDRGAIEATLEGKGARVWGILAVDPETEQAWVRRLMLRAPGK